MKENDMKKLRFFMLAVLIVGLLIPGISQASLDNEGKEFIMAFLPNVGTGKLELHLTSAVTTTVYVEYPANAPSFTTSVAVGPGDVTIVSLPSSVQNWPSKVASNHAVRAYSQDEFVAYLINIYDYTSDAALALPVDTMNTEYFVTSYQGGYPEFAVVSANDNTTVTITQPGGYSPITVLLNNGEGYLYRGEWSDDLTGTRISADKPVGMVNGNYCVNYDGSACDHIFEVAPPVQAWGKEIPVANQPETSLGVRYKILASRDNTEILQDETSIGTINAGEYILTERLPGDHIFSSEEPIFVVQFMANRLSSGGDPIGDPAMGNMTPAEQYRTSYTFSTVGGNQFIEHNVTIIAQSADVGTLLLDGSPLAASQFAQIGTSDYWVARPYLSDGVHSTESINPHGITVEGFNSYDSYLYPGGAMFEFINPIGDANPPICSFDNETGTGTATDNRPSEDTNGNDVLDPGEDLNGDGLIDEDTGIYSVELSDEVVNLNLTVNPFTPGDGTVSFSAALIDDAGENGTGFILVTDGAGNSCQAPVEIISNQPPVAQCKDVTLNLGSNGQAVLTPSQIDNGSYDPDPDDRITFSLSKTNFNCSDISTQHAVTLTVTDDSGESDSCVANVTVVDNLPPVPNAASLPQVTGQCSATIPAAPTAKDNCAGTVTGTTTDPLSYSAQGTYTVTWTFNDGNGNTATQTQQVVVQDTIAPIVVTQDITVQLSADGNASIIADAIDNGSTDNCCLGSKSINKNSFTCSDLGENTVTLTVTDCNGNSSSATAIVTVEDVTPPELIVPEDIIVEMQNAAGAEVSLTPTASDTCDADVEITSDEPEVFPLGTTTVTFTATDDSGNSTSESITVTVQGPTEIKENAKSCLSNYIDESKRFSKAIRGIDKSLDDSYWIDETHLDCKHGNKVFDNEAYAVRELMHLLKDKKKQISDEALACADSAIEKMVRVDRILAETFILDVEKEEVTGNQEKVDREIAKAYEELDRGDAERDAGKFDKAIKQYKKAWKHACHALNPGGKGSSNNKGSKGNKENK
jgi:hypothetical protein